MASTTTLEANYRKLHRALLLRKYDDVRNLIREMGFSPLVAKNLIDDGQFRTLTIYKLEQKLQRRHETPEPDGPSLLDRIPFNLEDFMSRMSINRPSLQDLALLANPGSVYHLSKILKLPLTNDRETFLREYNRKYYTRRCQDYYDHTTCQEKMGQYHDVEMIEASQPDLYHVIVGAMKGGHLDLVKLYLPRLLEDEDPTSRDDTMQALLIMAAAYPPEDIYHYVASLYPDDITRTYSENLNAAIEGDNLEIFKFLLDDGARVISPELASSLAAKRGSNKIIEELRLRGFLNRDRATSAAVGSGNMYVLERYGNALRESSVPPGMLYRKAANVQVCQMLYDLGIKPGGVAIFAYATEEPLKPDKVKFYLDHFDLADLRSIGESKPNLQNNLTYVFKQILISDDPEMMRMFLDHPNIAKYRPYRAFWFLLGEEDPGLPLTVREFVPVVQEMLEERMRAPITQHI